MGWPIVFGCWFALGGCNYVFERDFRFLDAPPESDTDNDGLVDKLDNCPDVANLTQHDEDDDDRGDLCDVCPHVADDNNDIDSDGVGDACDLAPTVANERWAYFDAFEVPAALPCPGDPDVGWACIAQGAGQPPAIESDAMILETRPEGGDDEVRVERHAPRVVMRSVAIATGGIGATIQTTQQFRIRGDSDPDEDGVIEGDHYLRCGLERDGTAAVLRFVRVSGSSVMADMQMPAGVWPPPARTRLELRIPDGNTQASCTFVEASVSISIIIPSNEVPRTFGFQLVNTSTVIEHVAYVTTAL